MAGDSNFIIFDAKQIKFQIVIIIFKSDLALSSILWVVVLDCDFFVQDIAFVPSYLHVS